MKRRACLVGIFPHEAAVHRLDAVLTGTYDGWQAGDRRGLAAGSLSRLCPERATGAVAELNTGD